MIDLFKAYVQFLNGLYNNNLFKNWTYSL